MITCLKSEHHDIKNSNIIGHADVAAARKFQEKTDPGLMFPWDLICNEGHGLCSNIIFDERKMLYKIGDRGKNILNLKVHLEFIGYNVTIQHDLFDIDLAYIVRAFNMHHNKGVEELQMGWGIIDNVGKARI